MCELLCRDSLALEAVQCSFFGPPWLCTCSSSCLRASPELASFLPRLARSISGLSVFTQSLEGSFSVPSSWPPPDRRSGPLLWAGLTFAQSPREHLSMQIIPSTLTFPHQTLSASRTRLCHIHLHISNWDIRQ